MSRVLIRNVAVLVVPETGECRVDEAQDIQVDNGRIIAITPTRATPHEPRGGRYRGAGAVFGAGRACAPGGASRGSGR